VNRRDFIKTLAGIPFLAWLKPEAAEVDDLEYIEGLEASTADLLEQTEQVVEATAKQAATGSHPLTVGPDGVIYVGNAFVPDGQGKLAVWNGSTWKEIERRTK
jgi:hypothetical protein